MPKDERERNFCFTLNNWTPEEESKLLTLTDQIKYCIIGREIGEKEETPHLQGFIMFINKKTFAQVKSYLGERCHFSKCKGSALENIAYCSKDNNFKEVGQRPVGKGKRTDIEEVKTKVLSGVPLNKIVMEATSYQAARHAELLYKYQPQNFDREPPKVYWFYGKTGTGKTRKAIEETEDKNDIWISGRDLKFWDGYYGQKTVIIDDFRKDFCTMHELLRILDRYPYRVNTKGSSVMLNATKIYITTPHSPQDTYAGHDDRVDQLVRRITEIRHFKGKCLL